MASPQREKGFTAINHETMDQLLSRDFSCIELKMIFYTLRHSWGRGKKVLPAWATGYDFAKKNHYRKGTIYRVIGNLKKHQILCPGGTFQKDYEKWTIPFCSLPQETKMVAPQTTTGPGDGLPQETKMVSPRRPNGLPQETISGAPLCRARLARIKNSKETKENYFAQSPNQRALREVVDTYLETKQVPASDWSKHYPRHVRAAQDLLTLGDSTKVAQAVREIGAWLDSQDLSSWTLAAVARNWINWEQGKCEIDNGLDYETESFFRCTCPICGICHAVDTPCPVFEKGNIRRKDSVGRWLNEFNSEVKPPHDSPMRILRKQN